MAIVLGLAAVVAGFTAIQGFNHDQLIFYQAALRMIGGQLPFRDFAVPQGPIAGMVLAPFLALAPTGGWGWVFASALLNAVATALVFALVHRAAARKTAIAAGVLTAIWFLPVFGSFYNDHLAYVFVLAAALALDTSVFLSGVLLALAFHTKQTVGVLGLAAFVITLRPRWKPFVVGTLATHAVVFVAIALVGGWSEYVRTVIEVPLIFAAGAPAKSPWRPFEFLILPYAIDPRDMGPGRLAFYPVVLAAYAIAYYLWRGAKKPAAFLWLSTLWCASTLGRGHAQLFFGMGGAMALALPYPRVVCAIFAALGLVQIAYVSPRVAHADPRWQATDVRPVRMPNDPLSRASFEIVEYLQTHPGRFAIGGGETYLVAPALRQAPQQPSVYFEYPLVIPEDIPLRDAWQDQYMIALAERDVRYLVVDRLWGEQYRVPRLKRFVRDHYRLAFRAPPLEVYELNAPSLGKVEPESPGAG